MPGPRPPIGPGGPGGRVMGGGGPAEGALSGFMSRSNSASVGAFAGRGDGRITGGRVGVPWGGGGGGAWFCIYCCC